MMPQTEVNNDTVHCETFNLTLLGEADSVITITAATIMGLVIIIANCTVILTISITKTLHNTTNFNILSLSVADLLVGVGALPMGIAYSKYRDIMPCIVSTVYMYIAHISITVTVGAMVIIAIDRRRAIAFPFKENFSVKFAKVTTAVNWTFAIVFNTIVFGYKVKREQLQSLPCRYPSDNQVVETIEFFLLFIIPMVLTLTAYGHITLTLYRKEKARMRSRKDAVALRHHIRAIKMMILIIVTFTICWLPHNILSLYLAWNPPPNYPTELKVCTLFLLASNSWLNVVVYASFSQGFRQAFAKHFSCCKIKKLRLRRLSSETTVHNSSLRRQMEEHEERDPVIADFLKVQREVEELELEKLALDKFERKKLEREKLLKVQREAEQLEMEKLELEKSEREKLERANGDLELQPTNY